jgi:hypothetical protein
MAYSRTDLLLDFYSEYQKGNAKTKSNIPQLCRLGGRSLTLLKSSAILVLVNHQASSLLSGNLDFGIA